MARRSRKRKIKPIDLEAAITEILQEYADAIEDDAVIPATEEVAKATVDFLKTAGDYKDRTGEYRKSFRYQVVKTYRRTEGTIYSEAPHYRLTHLLENGHAINGGTGRTKKYLHWKPADKYAREYFEKRLIENIQKVQI